MSSINHTLQGKLQSLLSFLSQTTAGFDAVAEEIDDPNLKTAMKAVAVESKQYANEISNQLQHFNINPLREHCDQLWKGIEVNVHEQAGVEKGGEITALCNNCEFFFGKLYQDVLQEYSPYTKLKSIITYQLFAIQCAFSKIKLLNTLRFTR